MSLKYKISLNIPFLDKSMQIKIIYNAKIWMQIPIEVRKSFPVRAKTE